MKIIFSAAAILLVMGVELAGGNDSFAQRRELPSQEAVEEAILQTAQVSYEALDPVNEPARRTSDDGSREGTLWWEWTAPRDGWFTTEAAMFDGGRLETFVFTGDRLEELSPAQSGNRLGSVQRVDPIFEARQGKRYNIMVRMLSMPATGDPEHPVAAYLHLRPSPGPPVNDALERRIVLSGPLPLIVKGTNLTVPSAEDHLLLTMALLGGPYGMPDKFGAAQWWEWTCPETGDYELRVSGLNLFVLGAARKLMKGGAVAPAGEWDYDGMAAHGRRFQATAGRVYDFAVASPHNWDSYSNDTFGEYSLHLSRETAETPPNTSPETAVVMPAALPSRASLFWPGRPDEASPPLLLWWVFTAPVRGMYHIDTAEVVSELVFEAGRNHSGYKVPLLGAGESVWIKWSIPVPQPMQINIGIEFLGVLGDNDLRAQATGLGMARDFHLYGHASTATLEQGEEMPAVPDLPPGMIAGSLWWKWTAPGKGWLRLLDSQFRVPVTVFDEGNPQAPPMTLHDVLEVEAGRTYLLRAGLAANAVAEACAIHLDFLPDPVNLTWQTALDLGVTRAPVWNPPGQTPAAGIPARQWFRWTAAEDGDFAFSQAVAYSEIEPGDIFTGPAAGKQVLPDPASLTYRIRAGRTYWLKYRELNTGAWFEMRPAPLTNNGDPSTAMALPAELPAAATAVGRGDVNSDLEVFLMHSIAFAPQLRDGAPVVWWKWQPQRAQRVRCHVTSIGEYNFSSAVFSGATPQTLVRGGHVRSDWPAFYFEAMAGETYWFAAAGGQDGARRHTAFRLELWPVMELPPSNDNFSGSRGIDDAQWSGRVVLYGVHLGYFGGLNPLRWEWTKATIEPKEPPVSVIDDPKGNLVNQSATTWWHWTAPVSGIYEFVVFVQFGGFQPDVRGGSDPVTPLDLTAEVYTGDQLTTLQRVMAYEPVTGKYCFRAEQGVRYSIRVASGEVPGFYELRSVPPSLEDIYDFAAMEDLRFEDVGNAWASDAGDGIPNVRKLLFGLDPRFPVDHIRNAALRARLPHQVPAQDGMLEMRCHPDPAYLPEGNAALSIPPGEASRNLSDWEDIYPVLLPGGELTIRHPGDSSPGFLRWDVLGKRPAGF